MEIEERITALRSTFHTYDINQLLSTLDLESRLLVLNELLNPDPYPCYKAYAQNKVLKQGLMLLKDSSTIADDLFDLIINQDQRGVVLLERIYKEQKIDMASKELMEAYRFFNEDYYSIFQDETNCTQTYKWCEGLRLSTFYLMKVATAKEKNID